MVDIEYLKTRYFYLDEPVKYKLKDNEINIYPIQLKDSEFFLSSVGILTVDKNSNSSIEIIQMSYLKFIVVILFQDEVNIQKLLNILILCLKLKKPQIITEDEKFYIIDKEEIGPGESGYVQLRLEDEIAVRRGDKFVVRFYSPMETIGGGVILEPNPGVKRRFQQDVIEELKRKESGSSADVIELHIKEHGDTMITSAELAKLTALSMDEVNQDIEELKENGQIYEPMSDEGWKKSLSIELKMKKEQGLDKIILVPGNHGEQFIREKLNLDMKYVVRTSNFIGYMLKEAQRMGYKKILMAGHIGKFIKLSAGIERRLFRKSASSPTS